MRLMREDEREGIENLRKDMSEGESKIEKKVDKREYRRMKTEE